MTITLILSAILLVIFLLDTFVLVPKGVDRWTKVHILEGDKTGWLTVNLKLVTSEVKQGQLWRPLTSMFLHAGVIHIAFNLVCLLNMGYMLQYMLRDISILLVFVGSGLFSAVCMMLLTKIEDGLGASTGIFGLLGAWLAIAVRSGGLSLSLLTPVNWVLLAIMVIVGFCMDKVTRLEHLTGMVGGILIGFLFTL